MNAIASGLGKAAAFCARHPRWRNRMIRLAGRCEGGAMHSTSYRQLMRKYYDVEIGRYSYGPGLTPGNVPPGTRVGNFCSIALGVLFFRRNHPVTRISQHPFFFNAASGVITTDAIPAVRDHPLHIGDDVWIGANAIITPGCHRIGLGAIVAAGAVVTKDVAPFSVVGGNPARLIRERFSPEVRALIVSSRWWERSIEELQPLLRLFLTDATPEGAQLLAERFERATASALAQ